MVTWPGWCSFARRGRACVRGRAVRTHALAATLVMFFVLFTSVDAYAAPKRDASSNGDGTTNYAVSSLPTNDGGDVVKSKWSAACWSLGKDPYGSGMTAEIRAKLSNEGTGGRFYEFANYFVGNEPTQTAVGMPGFMEFVQLWGMSYWYAANVPDELFRGAATDLVAVINGEDLGGGGSTSDGYYYFDVPIAIGGNFVSSGGVLNFRVGTYFTNRKAATNGDGASSGSRLLLDDVVTVRVPTSSFPVDLNDGYVGFVKFNTSSSSCHVMLGYAASSDVTFGTSSYTASFYDGTSATYNLLTCTGNAHLSAFVGSPVYEGDSTFRFDRTPDWNGTQGALDWSGVYSDGVPTNCYIGRRAVAGPPLPPDWPTTNWPDDEPVTTPEPPDVPGPDEPVGGPVNWPDVPSDPVVTTDPPVDPPAEPWTGILEPTNTTAQDYTPWLRAILAALNAINQNLATHCVHLQNALNDAAEWLNTELAKTFNAQRLSLQSYEKLLFSTLANRIDSAIYDLELYLQDLFEWLASQMSFSVSGGGFDDSTVVSWLKRIYERLGVQRWKFPGDKPTETELEDDFDWWAWLIDTLVGLLGNGLADGVDTLVGILEELTRLFPFSIPWDAAAIFGAIVADPVTPQWDFVIPAVAGWWPEFTIHVDLSALNGAAMASRTMFLLLWAMCLIKRTDWLVGIFEQSARIVTQFLEEM